MLTFCLKYDQQIKISSLGEEAHLKVFLLLEKSDYIQVCNLIFHLHQLLWRYLTAQNPLKCISPEIAMD